MISQLPAGWLACRYRTSLISLFFCFSAHQFHGAEAVNDVGELGIGGAEKQKKDGEETRASYRQATPDGVSGIV
jgi:hypothetical protein